MSTGHVPARQLDGPAEIELRNLPNEPALFYLIIEAAKALWEPLSLEIPIEAGAWRRPMLNMRQKNSLKTGHSQGLIGSGIRAKTGGMSDTLDSRRTISEGGLIAVRLRQCDRASESLAGQ